MYLGWVKKSNANILYVDWRGAKNSEEEHSFIKQFNSEIQKSVGIVLALVNMEGVSLGPGALESLTGTIDIRASKLGRIAFIGTDKVKDLIRKVEKFKPNMIERGVFLSEEEALEWLTENR